MGLENVNLLGAVAGAVAAMALGSLWYSPWFFGNQWQELVGQAPDEMGSAVPSMAIASVLFLVMGIGMGWVIPNGASIGIGLMWGFLAFWAFLLPATVINGIFERRPWALMAIFLGYLFIASMVIAAIVTFLGG
jgi:hypothetical protein